eukprot:FR734970.1.p4 GENE.FR734970.1~~FR734970.1.p4  ORF type:complete len:115 (+),score=21.27 FR734970.1:824-1168(+)
MERQGPEHGTPYFLNGPPPRWSLPLLFPFIEGLIAPLGENPGHILFPWVEIGFTVPNSPPHNTNPESLIGIMPGGGPMGGENNPPNLFCVLGLPLPPFLSVFGKTPVLVPNRIY